MRKIKSNNTSKRTMMIDFILTSIEKKKKKKKEKKTIEKTIEKKRQIH